MAWKRLDIDDLRLVLAEDEIDKLNTRSVDPKFSQIVQDQLDLAADAFRGAWSAKGYSIDIRPHYIAPEYRQFVLDYARYQIFTRFPMAEDFALSKPREELWKIAVAMLKDPYLATSAPDYEDDPEAAEEAAKQAGDSSVAMPWLRMPGEVGEYGFVVDGQNGCCKSSGSYTPGNVYVKYKETKPTTPQAGDICKENDKWILWNGSEWLVLSEDFDVSTLSNYVTTIDFNTFKNEVNVLTVNLSNEIIDVNNTIVGIEDDVADLSSKTDSLSSNVWTKSDNVLSAERYVECGIYGMTGMRLTNSATIDIYDTLDDSYRISYIFTDAELTAQHQYRTIATREWVNGIVGDINSILEAIN